MDIFSNIFHNFLVFLVGTTGSLGYAIIIFTFLIRSALLPLTLPSLRSSEKMKKVQPEIKLLQKKHGKDKQGFQKAQLELYKKYNINPLAGCIPQLAQLGILIVLYNVLIKFLNSPVINGAIVESNFWWLNLSQPDSKYILPVLAAVTQLILSLMIAPGAETRDVVPNKSKSKKIQTENKKEESTADMAQSMQQQMLVLMPIMTGFIALKFPSGLALYWVATTIFSIGQQLYISGPGGLIIYYNRALNFISRKVIAKQ
ncbi:membrane protein insertase YidC [Candidatus Woesebacteria bacterium]|nr:membrane protein insertase YidC [Candidatus Woesebacteria bacterium]